MIKYCLFDIYLVPSSSMEDTIDIGDFIFVKKNTKINRNDIIVYKDKYKPNKYYVKRCIGIPGDTIKIESNKILVNSFKEIKPKTAKFGYEIYFNNHSDTKKYLNSVS